MSKAPAPPLLRTRRLFEPARHSQQSLASAYQQVLPSPRPRPAGAGLGGAGLPPARAAVAS
jgi:hypothetical protein